MSEQTPAATVEEEVQEEVEPVAAPDADAALGDAGKKALDAMKRERAAAKAEATAAKAELDQLRTELALKDKPAEEQALETARAEARAEATKAANARLLRSELKAAATGKLADPTDAALYIKLDDFTVSDDGEVDSDALSEAIDDLLTRKPHLAAAGGSKFGGTADQGAKGKTSKPAQMTQSEFDRIKSNPHAVMKAKEEGLLNALLGIDT